MKATRPTLKERLEVAYKDGLEDGMNLAGAAAQRDILNAAAELAQANAKLTYAISRMIAEKGW